MSEDVQNIHRAVAVLPACDLLFQQTPQHWMKRFHDMSGLWPTDVALPAITNQGAAFESAHADEHRLIGPESNLDAWVRALREHGDDLRIWLLVNPNYESIGSELVVILDQWDEPVPGHACLGNPLVSKITTAIIDELTRFQVEGIVFDLTDIYPNTGSSLYPKSDEEDASGLRNTCFCKSCVSSLDKYGWRTGGTSFRTGDLTLARFVLQNTPTGTSHIDVNQTWIDTANEELLLQYARERGFVEQGDPEDTETQRGEAQEILRYLTARGKVTSQAVRDLCEIVRGAGMQTALILGDSDFDLSQNTSLTYLNRAEAADEYWVPLSQVETIREEGPPVLQFLDFRGTYYANSLFEDIWRVFGASPDDVSEYEARLRRTAGRIRGDGAQIGLGKGGAVVATMSEEIGGFVGLPFERDDVVKAVRELARHKLTPSRRTEAVARCISGAGSSVVEDDGTDPANPLYE